MSSSDSVFDRLLAASAAASRELGIPPLSEARINDALAGAIDPRRLVDNLAEAWRTSPDAAEALLRSAGAADLLRRLAKAAPAAARSGTTTGQAVGDQRVFRLAEGCISVRAFNPAFDEPMAADESIRSHADATLAAFLPRAAGDPLAVLYRDRPREYADGFLRDEAPRITRYIREQFGTKPIRYLVNSGIGANEQFNYFVADIFNGRQGGEMRWLLANSPLQIARLPADASADNSLFLEFSRSGITEETIKLHELTPRRARRVVFANTGPLKKLGLRDGNLVLSMPDEVSGRYGRNRTPILLAPMFVAGMDVRRYWSDIESACAALDISNHRSLPIVLALYIRLLQQSRGINHIYVGTNDERLRHSADEFCQFWNEGVNRDGNDITMSRYLGLPRDSHMNLEAVLGTSEHKLAVFLLRTEPDERDRHPLLADAADAIRPEHAGLTAHQTELILALANVQRCAEKMPTVLVAVRSADLTASAWLGQLWADVTLVYSRLIGIDPGSNPEVKAVRTRAANWLASRSDAMEVLR